MLMLLLSSVVMLTKWNIIYSGIFIIVFILLSVKSFIIKIEKMLAKGIYTQTYVCTQDAPTDTRDCSLAHRSKGCEGRSTGTGTSRGHLCGFLLWRCITFSFIFDEPDFLNKIIKTLKFNHSLMEKLRHANAPTSNNLKA